MKNLILGAIYTGITFVVLDLIGFSSITYLMIGFGILWILAETDKKSKEFRKKKYGNSNLFYVTYRVIIDFVKIYLRF